MPFQPQNAKETSTMSTHTPARRSVLLGVTVGVTALALSACGATAKKDEASTGAAGGSPASNLQIMVPNAPGGGYDTTARTAAKVMEAAKITGAIQVFNLPGAGGTVGLQRTVNEKGNGKLAMQMGLGVVGAAYTQKSQATLNDTTPIAKLIEEAGAIVVPKDSPYQTSTPSSRRGRPTRRRSTSAAAPRPAAPTTCCRCSWPRPSASTRRPSATSASTAAASCSRPSSATRSPSAASGFGEFLDQVKAGQVKVLAVTSEKRIDALPDVPTLKESGIDLVFTNWRGIVAPPGISDADKATWIDALTTMHASQGWKDEMQKRGWTDAFVTGDEFGTFLKEQDASVAEILTTLGLAS